MHLHRQFESFVATVDLEGRDYPDQLSFGRRGNDNFAGNLSESRLSSAWTRQTVYDPDPLLYADKYAQIQFNEHWHRLLIDFGLRNLTYSSDPLIALSAIAKMFAVDLEDLYMASIWMKDFRKGLLWNMRWYQTSIPLRVAPLLSSILPELPEHQRVTASSGPSWSWVSRFTEPDKINFSVVASQKPLHDNRGVQLVEYFALPLFDDIFGPLKVGMLTLKGYMTRLDLVFSYSNPDASRIDNQHGVLLLNARSIVVNDSRARIKSCVDCIPEIIPRGFKPEAGSVCEPVALEALIISGFSANRVKYNYALDKRAIYYSLLLKPMDFIRSNGEFVYQRVGIFSIDPEISVETFKDPIGFDVFAPAPETWTGWAEREVDIVW